MEPGSRKRAVSGKDALMLADARRIRLGVLGQSVAKSAVPRDGGTRRDRSAIAAAAALPAAGLHRL